MHLNHNGAAKVFEEAEAAESLSKALTTTCSWTSQTASIRLSKQQESNIATEDFVADLPGTT